MFLPPSVTMASPSPPPPPPPPAATPPLLMAVGDLATATPVNPSQPPQPLLGHSLTAKPSESCGSDSNPPSTPRPPEFAPSSSGPIAVFIPSYAKWFSWNQIHETERRLLPEFFDAKSHSRNPGIYKYYRDSIIKKYRENPMKKITFTEVRRGIVGDAGSVRRVFDFLESWGLINYGASRQNVKLEGKGGKSAGGASPSLVAGQADPPASAKKEAGKKVCDGCNCVISIACFSCDKVDLVLCARCFVRGNYRVGLSSADFKRVDISEEIVKKDWNDRETLLLLEAVLHYGDDWKKVAQHVTGRSEKDCVDRFIKLPFAEQFMGPNDIDEIDNYCSPISDPMDETEEGKSDCSIPAKRRHLTPLADASNPIMVQAAFLSALVGSDIAKAAGEAAISALSGEDSTNVRGQSLQNFASSERKDVLEDSSCNGHAMELQERETKAHSLLEQEEKDVEDATSAIILQMKETKDKIIRFEQFELAMEKEWAQLRTMQNQLFADQLRTYSTERPIEISWQCREGKG